MTKIRFMFQNSICHIDKYNILSLRILMSHTGPVWALQRKGDILISGSGDKTVIIAFYVFLKQFLALGPVVQSWVSTNPGLKFNSLF